VKPVLSLLRKIPVHAMAHVTGGGLPGNVPRSLPPGTTAVFFRHSWPVPPVFSTIVGAAAIGEEEALRTFNMGLGYVLSVDPANVDAALRHFRRALVPAWIVGEVRRSRKGEGPFRLEDL
jgi:phosphoribosylformylglycinamidine cyclo-ligase